VDSTVRLLPLRLLAGNSSSVDGKSGTLPQAPDADAPPRRCQSGARRCAEVPAVIAAGARRTTLPRLAKTAGVRWSIDRAFESGKQYAGLAAYEVRSWTGWHRHVTLSLLAHAVLAAVRKLADEPAPKGQPIARS
jgi:hypothetical protein